MADNNWSFNFGIIGLLIAYALHLWAVANGYEFLATLAWWYCAINIAVYAFLLLCLLAIAGIFIMAAIGELMNAGRYNLFGKKSNR